MLNVVQPDPPHLLAGPCTENEDAEDTVGKLNDVVWHAKFHAKRDDQTVVRDGKLDQGELGVVGVRGEHVPIRLGRILVLQRQEFHLLTGTRRAPVFVVQRRAWHQLLTICKNQRKW